ncbi:HAD family hydrolase [Candidatus Woesearchaeota archaeon]|nr:HAD family hydrolase [Candidatus Woesearchaeota archaeon]
MIKAIVFDCDGTLYSIGDAIEGDLIGIRRAYKELGVSAKVPSKGEFLKRAGYRYPDFFIGLIPNDLFDRAYPLVYKYSVEETVSRVREDKGWLFNNVKVVLANLKSKGIRLGLVTNGTKSYIWAVAQTYALDRIFDVIMSVEEVEGDKGDLLKFELNELKVKPNEAIMVGDRKSDIDAAKKAGCRAVGVTYGYGEEEELKDADFKIRKIEELAGIVENG